jgi:orotidine-5'-phosphate decarboxylase
VVGLDPRLAQIPGFIKEEMIMKHGRTFDAAARCLFEFNKGIINAIKDIVPAVKPQMAFYENYGFSGVKAFEATVNYAKQKGLIVIGDAKRNDIGSTAQAYADGHLGHIDLFGSKAPSFDVDCMTVTPYLGSDGIKPFIGWIKELGKGIFVLVKTSNPSSGELQDLQVEGKPIFEIMGKLVDEWGSGTEGTRGYKSVGAVIGATYPEQAKALRQIMPKTIFLVPGYGAQGGGAAGVVPCFNTDGYGAIVNSSRGVIFAYQKSGHKEEEFDKAAGDAALAMKEDIDGALKAANICAW